MDFVTITDHNQIEGALVLKERYPHEVLTGMESTTYFPEDGCKVHVLIYGLDWNQYHEIEKRRQNIYDLREYLRDEDLVHAVAHPTYSINRKMSVERLERLMLLFDHFECINGSRSRRDNDIWQHAISTLTPARLEALSREHAIEPYSGSPWIKGMFGGSDDHSGLFVGKTYTEVDAQTPEEVLQQLRLKRSDAAGRHNDYQGLAFAVYKVAYDFSRSRSKVLNTSMISAVNGLLFDRQDIGFKGRLVLERMKRSKSAREDGIKRAVLDLVSSLQENKDLAVEEKLSLLSEKVSGIADEFMKEFLCRISDNVQAGDMIALIRGLSASLPGVFLSLPFFTTLGFLNDSRQLLAELQERFGHKSQSRGKRVLWFTDTLTDLNGVGETLRKLGVVAHDRSLDLTIAACLLEGERLEPMPPNIMRLPCIFDYTPSFFKSYTLRVPSVLASVKMIYEADPDEIYISTPGPVGMLGALLAKLLRVPCTGIYHTDFTRQAFQIVGEEAICGVVEDYTRWFYSQMNTISVPTDEYISLLADRGFERNKMVKFRRGIDPVVFSPRSRSDAAVRDACGFGDGTTLLYAGRVSKEKSVDFLARVYENILRNNRAVNLLFAGDGPYLEEFREKMRPFYRVAFLGRVPRHELPALYSTADLLVFPSVTDTFGMVVLEAQACGLPAVVSDVGGPKEIVVPGKTGFVAKADDSQAWANKIEGIISMKTYYPELYEEMRLGARQHVLDAFRWDLVLRDIYGSAIAEDDRIEPAKPTSAHDKAAAA
jgi:glycosyltransferase involved in cell wall biosynthesis/predicted metal-dependent phosphoesterase TrpH